MTATAGAAHIGLVVEGPGDKGALPILLRNYLHQKGVYADVLGKPVPLKGKGSATTTNGVEGYVLAAARPGCVGIIVLVDADKDASCQLGPELLERASGLQSAPVVIAVAEKDFEDWLHASIETLELGVDTWDPTKRGKSVIEAALSPDKYIKSTMQARLTHRMDIELARSRNSSLDRMLRKLDGMVAVLPS
jgi:hypothetical protein